MTTRKKATRLNLELLEQETYRIHAELEKARREAAQLQVENCMLGAQIYHLKQAIKVISQ